MLESCRGTNTEESYIIMVFPPIQRQNRPTGLSNNLLEDILEEQTGVRSDTYIILALVRKCHNSYGSLRKQMTEETRPKNFLFTIMKMLPRATN